jgi:zinc/manganese transport system ATP-binding protein
MARPASAVSTSSKTASGCGLRQKRAKMGLKCINLLEDGVGVRRRVGYVIQNFAFDPPSPFTAGEVVLMGRYGRLGYLNRPKEPDIRAARQAMKMLGIEDLADAPIGTLSGGQQQKVLIAQNLAKEPEIMLLDEPFSNLDLIAKRSVSTLLHDLARAGITVIVVSHAFDDLPPRPIRILVMNRGEVTVDRICTPDEVEDVVRTASGSDARA